MTSPVFGAVSLAQRCRGDPFLDSPFRIWILVPRFGQLARACGHLPEDDECEDDEADPRAAARLRRRRWNSPICYRHVEPGLSAVEAIFVAPRVAGVARGSACRSRPSGRRLVRSVPRSLGSTAGGGGRLHVGVAAPDDSSAWMRMYWAKQRVSSTAGRAPSRGPPRPSGASSRAATRFAGPSTSRRSASPMILCPGLYSRIRGIPIGIAAPSLR